MPTNEIPTLQQASEQLAEACGFRPFYELRVEDDAGALVLRIPARALLPEPVQDALRDIERRVAACDREQMTLPSGAVIELNRPRMPLQEGGIPLPESPEAMMLRAIWGDADYERFRAAGGSAQLLTLAWQRVDHDFGAWSRSKSA